MNSEITQELIKKFSSLYNTENNKELEKISQKMVCKKL